MLLEKFPKWRKYTRTFPSGANYAKVAALLEQALKNQVGVAGEKLGRTASNMFLIVDAQSVKNTDTARLKGL
ncbi:hypothetical protein SAMN05216317_10845 [Nitrosomonas eutropha]|uniref:Uncharacterized protein n=1 Tax=Nitrosomonas eutropha TaxID=916 RepID=A0ABX5M8D4_9PROT|nr:hypothetical protein C8R14_1171 [Nitrosomonas eutropha]SCX20317.1 hypothetical protein SAMN05216379_11452 [Nitrosomonas eutropha]SDW59268.1 hypothetical protein SAMN05216317_10845 [Nitrosomonas eutropha]SEI91333.1 hypothetical protein SAMN05216318_11544 [Nitrosomonas eutropha]